MIDSVVIKQIYLGDGITTEYPFVFPAVEADHVKVAIYDIETEIETQLKRDYFVDWAAKKVLYPGYPPGEELPESEQPPPLPIGKKLVIYRRTPVTQLKDLGDKYPLPFIEEMVDKATLILQEQAEKLDRAVIVEMGGNKTPEDIVHDITRLKEYRDEAEQSAADAAASKAAAEASEQNAASSESAAEIAASGAARTLQEGQSILASTAEYARQAAQDAAGIHEGAIPAWNPKTVYSYPTVVAYTDGQNYRCIGENVPAGTIPTTSNAWVRTTTANGDDFWEIDMHGGIQPRINPTYASAWDLDDDSNIQPRGLDEEITIAAETAAQAAALEAIAAMNAASGSAGEAAASALAAKNSEDHIDEIVTNATLLELDADDNITTKEEEEEESEDDGE